MDSRKGIRYFQISLTARVHVESVGATIIAWTGIQKVSGLNLGGETTVLRFLVFLLSSSREMNNQYLNILIHF
jgi:hypothetical protein